MPETKAEDGVKEKRGMRRMRQFIDVRNGKCPADAVFPKRPDQNRSGVFIHKIIWVMNIVLYGIPEARARRLADRYGFGMCRSFDDLETGNRLLLQPYLITDEEQLAFFEQMTRYEQLVDIVIVGRSDAFSAVHYSSSPGKLFTVNRDDDEESLDYELDRIVETQLGLVCAHEGIDDLPE